MTERGIAHDREWMIVDATGRFITQREVPRLALIQATAVGARAGVERAGPAASSPYPSSMVARGLSVTVWRDTLPAVDQGDAAALALSAWLGQPVRLVRFDPAERRYCNPEFAGPGGAHHSFADGYPVLVVSEASLADLNDRLETPLPINRFRPNVLLSGVDAFLEDHIDELKIGAVSLKLVKPCTRCQITTTDQATAVVGVEPLQTLSSLSLQRHIRRGRLRHERHRDGGRGNVDRRRRAGELLAEFLKRSTARPALRVVPCGKQRARASRHAGSAMPNACSNLAVASTP